MLSATVVNRTTLLQHEIISSKNHDFSLGFKKSFCLCTQRKLRCLILVRKGKEDEKKTEKYFCFNYLLTTTLHGEKVTDLHTEQ